MIGASLSEPHIDCTSGRFLRPSSARRVRPHEDQEVAYMHASTNFSLIAYCQLDYSLQYEFYIINARPLRKPLNQRRGGTPSTKAGAREGPPLLRDSGTKGGTAE